MVNYIFLQENERQQIAKTNQSYLIKKVEEHEFFSVTGSRNLNINSRSCVSNYMFRFRRTDIKDRNEWSNYTNWEFEDIKPLTITDYSNNSKTWFYQTGDLSNNTVINNKVYIKRHCLLENRRRI